MNGRERIFAVLDHQMPDRVPVYPKISFATVNACPGTSIFEYLNDPVKMAQCTIGAYRRFGWDGVAMHTSIAWSGITLGSQYIHPADDIPHRTECLIPEIGTDPKPKQLIMKDPMDVPVMKTVVDAVALVQKEIGSETCIMAWIDGPLNIGSQLCPLDELLIALIEEPEFCHMLFSQCVDQSKRYAKALVEAGADIIAFGHATASCSVISKEAYKEFALPYEKELVSHIHSLGAKAVTHICGNIHPIASLIASNGSDIMDFDSVNNISELIRTAPHMIFRGNISPSLLATGSPKQIEEEAQKLLEMTTDFPGYILGSGCEVNRNVPAENLDALVRAAKLFGIRQPQ